MKAEKQKTFKCSNCQNTFKMEDVGDSPRKDKDNGKRLCDNCYEELCLTFVCINIKNQNIMKTKIEIKSLFTGKVMFEFSGEDNSISKTIYQAIKSGADLSGADLFGADLSGADLSGADLFGADLSGANLSGANLSKADLSKTDLSGADLSGADLFGADLSGANLSGANLSKANLSGANLSKADLSGADLSIANLSGADLSKANLSGVDLSGADLSKANLLLIKSDFFFVLLYSIPEIKFLKQNIIDGKIDGSTYEYEGKCACLSGTLVNGAKKTDGPQEKKVILKIMSCRSASRPIERFFLTIKVGDTPKNSQFSKIVFDWLEEFEILINPII